MGNEIPPARKAALFLLENRDLLWDAIVQVARDHVREINAADVEDVLQAIVELN